MPFNGGKSQVGLNFLQGGGAYPFLNRLKESGFWSWFDNTAVRPMTPDLFDSNGYPTTLVQGGVVSGQMILPALRGGNYVMKWDGNGTCAAYDVSVTYNITGASQASSCVLTIVGNNIRANDRIIISGVGGMTQLNGNTYTVSSVVGSAVTISVNSLGFTAYTSGGSAAFSLTSVGGVGGRFIINSSGSYGGSGITIGITTTGVSNLRLVHEDDEALLDAGNVFGVKFKQKLQQANFGVIRFMNWQQAATASTNVTNWDTANKPVNYFQYQSGQIRLDFLCNAAGSGVTSNGSGSDYTVTASSAWTGLNDKATVHIVWGNSSPTSAAVTHGSGNNITWTSHGLVAGNRVYFTDSTGTNTGFTISALAYPFTNIYYVKTVTDANNFTISATNGGTVLTVSAVACTARCAPTLSVGGTTAKYILDMSCAPLTNGGNTFLVGGSIVSLTTLVYDAAVDVWINDGFVTGPGYLQNGVPYSLMIQLCNEVGAHPWFNAPELSCTPITDYWSSLAALVISNGGSWMIPRFEGPNECFGSNVNTKYPIAVVTSYGNWLGDPIHNWYGKAVSLIGQAINTAYGSLSVFSQTKYQVLCGVQTATFRNAAESNASDPRLTSADYVAHQSGSAASNWVTHVCGANYWGPSIYGRNQEVVLAFSYAVTNAGNSAAQLVDATSYESHDADGVAISSFTVASPGLITTPVAHGLFVGQIITLYTTGALPNGMGVGNLWVNTTPSSTTFTISSADPNNGGAAPIAFADSGSGSAVVIPNNGPAIPAVNVTFQNITTWAAGKNAAMKVGCYEGGYSPDYTTDPVVGNITAASKAASSIFTIPTMDVQGLHGPVQANAANSPFVAGMYLYLTGLSGSGWSALNNTTVLITSVSGSSVTTNLNSSGFAAAFSGSASAYPCNSAGTVFAYVWLNLLRFGGKSSTNMQANMTTMYNDIPVDFPSMFQLSGNTTGSGIDFINGPASSNVWSVLEDIYQTPDPPQWLAAVAFNAGGSGPTGPTNTFAFSITMQGTTRITTKMVGY